MKVIVIDGSARTNGNMDTLLQMMAEGMSNIRNLSQNMVFVLKKLKKIKRRD